MVRVPAIPIYPFNTVPVNSCPEDDFLVSVLLSLSFCKGHRGGERCIEKALVQKQRVTQCLTQIIVIKTNHCSDLFSSGLESDESLVS